MRLTICLAVALAICANSAPALAKHHAKPAAFQLTAPHWTLLDKKDGKLKELIDADGNYITQTIGGKHIDHGTATMKDAKRASPAP